MSSNADPTKPDNEVKQEKLTLRLYLQSTSSFFVLYLGIRFVLQLLDGNENYWEILKSLCFEGLFIYAAVAVFFLCTHGHPRVRYWDNLEDDSTLEETQDS